jgi:hypothetical protein
MENGKVGLISPLFYGVTISALRPLRTHTPRLLRELSTKTDGVNHRIEAPRAKPAEILRVLLCFLFGSSSAPMTPTTRVPSNRAGSVGFEELWC